MIKKQSNANKNNTNFNVDTNTDITAGNIDRSKELAAYNTDLSKDFSAWQTEQNKGLVDYLNTINSGTAQKNFEMNMVNQDTPYGSLTWTQSGTNPDGTPRYTATQSLSPEQQRLLNLQTENRAALGSAAGSLFDIYAPLAGKPLDLSNTSVSDYLTGLYGPQFQRQQDESWTKLQTDLANRGIRPGSDAWNKATTAFNTSKGESWNDVLARTRAQSVNEILQQWEAPLRAIGYAQGWSNSVGPTQPSFVSTPTYNQPFSNMPWNSADLSVSPFYNVSQVSNPYVDTSGIQQQAYENQYNRWKYGADQDAAMQSGLFQLGGTVLGAAVGGPMGATIGNKLTGGWSSPASTPYDYGWTTNYSRY